MNDNSARGERHNRNDRDRPRQDRANRDRPNQDRRNDSGNGRSGYDRNDRDNDRRNHNDRRNAEGRERSATRARGEYNRTALAPSARRRGADLPRQIAFDVLQQVAESDAYANLVLPPALNRAGIRGRDAGFATELAYGTLRMQGRYDAIIAQCTDRGLDKIDPPVLSLARMGAHQLLGMRVPSHAAVSETVGLARQEVGAGAAQFLNAILRRVSERPLDEWLDLISAEAESPTAALAKIHSHPLWITRALKESLVGNGRPAEEIESLLQADNKAPRVTLVARPGLCDRDQLAKYEQGEPGDLTPTAFILDGSDPANIREVRDGEAGVQDEGSQLVTLAFADTPVEGNDKRWLDMCAGPGGKAALLGALAAQRGARLVANEVQPHRADLVDKSTKAIPARAIERIQVWDGREIGDLEPDAYDRVMLDAPCTGLGALRRRPESRWRRTVADLTQLTGLQRELLASALKTVRVGGVVGYVTCSPHLAETRFIVDDVLKSLPEGSVERIDARELVRDIAGEYAEFDGDRLDVQLWPHVHGTDAMHLTLLRRLA
ncbi:RsmB/NOP family class I SAM-dependent RNA methyltransferase [Populibacterium corticicola]|uniref:RsmB/NOP family class I SAM-dependent RNA methyltransferase n=1 Tax=Populibacterium corticicola TaxID=1812826 RepID=A0ABW5XCM3_9MICO